ncbi:hypothetical protein [Treponema sp. Marseille-Q3903]|uniref:hypothetical protein n=1 Tax=Treponema sp. Marseille-Q3903 TaxID=2766703 RepID=UPI001651FF7E|nr:hypothetical protein [Treponema sp. Marseille-Q3903]MBC6713773.1 hypothetical protein [Treponema sp. Marseille-Q3903]
MILNIEYTEPTKCPFYFSYNEVYCCEDISNGFYIYISKQIKTILNSLSIKNLGISMDEVYQTYSFDREYLINHLPFKYKKEKRLILKMEKLQEELPYTGGKGGDFNLIEWLVENAVTALYTTLVVSLLTFPTKKILTSAKQSLKVRKRIRTYIQDNQTDFSDISMEDIKTYFHVPRNFNGSKEDLIEDIIYKKAEHVKKELIEKLRPSIVQKKLKCKSTKNQ